MGQDSLTAKVEDFVAERIRSGEIRPGDQLPSRAVLAQRLGTHPTTVTLAMKRLAKRHPLRSVPGRGLFLADPSTARRPLTIGLIGRWAGSLLQRTSADPLAAYYHGPILQALLTRAEERRMALTAIPNTAEEPLDFDGIVSFNLDCVVSLHADLGPETVSELRRRELPLVHGHRGGEKLRESGISYVDLDNVRTFRDTVRLFAERGHRRVAAIFGQPFDEAWVDWRDAFLLEAVSSGLSVCPDYVRMMAAAQSHEDRSRQLRHELEFLLDLPDPPTAVYLWSVLEGLGVVEDVAAHHGLTAGKDLSLVCRVPRHMQEDAPFSCWVYDPAQVGTQLVDTAQKLVDEPHRVFHIDLPMEFVDKGSVAILSQ